MIQLYPCCNLNLKSDYHSRNLKYFSLQKIIWTLKDSMISVLYKMARVINKDCSIFSLICDSVKVK
jgi:hypothetical protein